jgi:cathepsin B
MNKLVAALALGTAGAETFVEGGVLGLTWKDCGDASTKAKISGLTPKSLTLGQKTTVTGSGTISEGVSDGKIAVSLKASIISKTYSGDVCTGQTFTLPLGVGSIQYDGVKCPLAAGAVDVPVEVLLSSALPSSLARAAITVSATSTSGDKLFCMGINTAPQALGAGDHPIADGKTKVNAHHLIDAYNGVKDTTWTAGHNEYFGDMTFDDARVLMGTALSHISEHLDSALDDAAYASVATVPAEFDSRTNWPGLIHPIRDQQRCGSCWAFSASEVLSDRVAIATGKASAVLSAEDMVACDKKDMGCQGGSLPNAWSYLTNTGIVTDTCMPYAAGGGTVPSCPSKCVDSESFSRQKATGGYAITGVPNMQKEIMTHGPIQVAFKVYKSFMSYKSGVYQKHFWELMPEGGHAVKMIGWGTDSGTDYWLVANSWGTSAWGMQGLFKIRRGVDACGMETMGPPYAGVPAASSVVV